MSGARLKRFMTLGDAGAGDAGETGEVGVVAAHVEFIVHAAVGTGLGIVAHARAPIVDDAQVIERDLRR